MKVLVADDSNTSRVLLEASLHKWGYDVVCCSDGTQAWNALNQADAPLLVLLDWIMPGLTGPEICRKIREANREPYTYIILITSKNESGDMVEGMLAGADDYVTKPISSQELEVRMRAARRILELQDQLMRAREALRIQATHDALTSLKNRAAVEECLEREISRCEREWGRLGVVMIDLDSFKQVNDSLGHAAGDAVLIECARRMQRSIRNYDFLARYGGEEFLMVLPGLDPPAIQVFCDRVRMLICSEPILFEGNQIRITASVGATAWVNGSTSEQLIRASDSALYRAKQTGRNRVEFIAVFEDAVK